MIETILQKLRKKWKTLIRQIYDLVYLRPPNHWKATGCNQRPISMSCYNQQPLCRQSHLRLLRPDFRQEGMELKR